MNRTASRTQPGRRRWPWFCLTAFFLLLAACRQQPAGPPTPTVMGAPPLTATPTLAPPTLPPEPGAATDTPEPPTADQPITVDALLNAAYPIEGPAGGVAQLSGGLYTEAIPDIDMPLSVTLLPELIAYGDLNGDGLLDAAVVLVLHGGGTGHFYHLYGVLNQGGQPEPGAPYFIGDRSIINNVAVQAGQITIDFITQSPEDPLCCPTLSALLTFVRQGDGLSLIAEAYATATPPPVVFNPQRISFDPGATSSALEGSVGAGQTADYMLRALGGQTMLVDVASTANVALTVYGLSDGRILLDRSAGATVWVGTLPATQDYALQVVGPASGSATFGLSVTIPQRLEFATGATSARVDGRVSAGSVNDYILRAGQGQLMDVSLSSAGDTVWLTIYGLADGQVLVRSALGATSWRGALPATQDYVIKAVSSGPAANYTLSVIIPQRIQFRRGAISGSVQGRISPQQTVSYILGARAGQTMTVDILSPNNDVLLTIYGLDDGQPLVRYVSGATSWSGSLPATQDYMIEAFGGGSRATDYTIEVTIVTP